MEKFEEKIESKKEAEIQPPEFEIEEFEGARKGFENLTKELIPALCDHEYNMVIGDDTSGRIPTRVIGGLMTKIYGEDKVDSPQIRFLSGSSTENNLNNYLKKLIEKKEVDPNRAKALLATEVIERGETLACFIRIFKKVGIPCDIAALDSKSIPGLYQEAKAPYYHPEFEDIKIFSGKSKTSGDLHFYGYKHRKLTGVEKAPGKLFAKARREDLEMVRKTRKDVEKMVDYLKQIYDREKEKIEK